MAILQGSCECRADPRVCWYVQGIVTERGTESVRVLWPKVLESTLRYQLSKYTGALGDTLGFKPSEYPRTLSIAEYPPGIPSGTTRQILGCNPAKTGYPSSNPQWWISWGVNVCPAKSAGRTTYRRVCRVWNSTVPLCAHRYCRVIPGIFGQCWAQHLNTGVLPVISGYLIGYRRVPYPQTLGYAGALLNTDTPSARTRVVPQSRQP